MIEWLSKNWPLKLIALVLAIGLWYYAQSEEAVEVTRTVPLQIQVKNKQISLLEASVTNIQVTLVAPRSELSGLASGEIVALHEIGAEVSVAGEYSFRLEPRDIRVPNAQIRVVSIEPETVQVKLDELIVQKLPVKPDFIGEPAFGFKVQEDELQLDPNAILIEGPKGELETLNFVKTESIDLVGRIRSLRRTVSLNLPANVKPLSEPLIDVYIPIREEFSEKSFQEISVKALRSSESTEKVEMTPAKISFTLKGALRQIETLAPDKMLAYVDISDLELGEHVIPVTIVLPENVSLKENEPVTVKVTISKK